jgi:hypothetical protein
MSMGGGTPSEPVVGANASRVSNFGGFLASFLPVGFGGSNLMSLGRERFPDGRKHI